MKEARSLLDVPMSEEMIQGLEKFFPPKCPAVTDSERDIFFYAGQVKLIEICRSILTMQRKDDKDDSHRGRSAADKLAGL